MIAAAVACLPVFYVGHMSRWNGVMFFAYSCAYTASFVIAETVRISMARLLSSCLESLCR